MVKDLISQPPGATPLQPDELEGLRPGHIRTREDLNEWEARNILKASNWAFSRRRDVLNEAFIRALHHRMFDDTWEWAGTYRNSDKNIGIPWEQVHQGAVRNLCDNAKAQLAGGENVDDVAVWVHQQLTYIHPFPNGNGRHARLVTDLLLKSHGREQFTWGVSDIARSSENRARYIASLKAADKGDYQALSVFVRSKG